MDEINSGTNARDGQSGGVDFEIDSVGVRVFRRGRGSGGRGLVLHAQQLQHLRQDATKVGYLF